MSEQEKTGPGALPDEASVEAQQQAREEILKHAAAEEIGDDSDYLLVARDLVAGYVPGVNILNGCTLTLSEGEIVAIIG